jgi:prepilin-type N-terminal cleavage/methylation domain-containing protein
MRSKHPHFSPLQSAGFTLLEVVVVLLVVSLLAGGVVAGRSLIERSEAQKMMGDAQSYAKVLDQFQKTYNALPGDMSNATSYFAGAVNGNGNGVIDAAEGQLFWQHLQAAKLLPAGARSADASLNEPVGSKTGTGYQVVQDATLGAVFQLSAYQMVSGTPTPGYAAFTPKEAQAIMQSASPVGSKAIAVTGLGASGNCTVTAGSTTSFDSTNTGKACIIRFIAAELLANAATTTAVAVACGNVGDTRETGAACPTGYAGAIIESCTADGSWQESMQNCKIVDCGGGYYNDTRSVGCGLGSSGQITQRCEAGGQWKQVATTCATALGACTAGQTGQTRTRACPVGQTGGYIDTCNGANWTMTSGSCANNTCGTGSAVGDIQTAACPTGYTGSSQEKCTDAGTWMALPNGGNCTLDAAATCGAVGDTRVISCQSGSPNVWNTTSSDCKDVSCGDKPIGFLRDSNSFCAGSSTLKQQEICDVSGQWSVVTSRCAGIPSCTLPWGGTIAPGASVSAYSVGSVNAPATCPAPVTRTCIDGSLNGSGDFASCSVITGCALPWGGTIAEGASVSAYATATATWPSYCAAPTTRTCTAGVLSGTGNFQSCSFVPPAGCVVGAPEAGIINSRSYVMQGYQSGASWAGCLVQYSVTGCNTPWSSTRIAHGASVSAYSAESVAYGSSCPAATTRTCANGVLSGTGDYGSCTVYSVAPSCAAILAANPSATSGAYTIDPDGAGGNAAFSVSCDMTTGGGGWTLVMRGVGAMNAGSIRTTSAFNAANATAAQTFKLADSDINAILTGSGGYMLTSSGSYTHTRYFKPSCVFAQTTSVYSSNVECTRSYSSAAWAGQWGGGYTTTVWRGLADCPGDRCYFVTDHTVISTWLVGNGAPSTYCYGTTANCNFRMWVR